MVHEKIMLRDIDFAAVAVRKAIAAKFERQQDLKTLDVSAGERTIIVRDGDRLAEGTRDDLLAGIREAGSYDELWQRWAT
jgi:hypothetical protein